jgi:hypothetical protein
MKSSKSFCAHVYKSKLECDVYYTWEQLFLLLFGIIIDKSVYNPITDKNMRIFPANYHFKNPMIKKHVRNRAWRFAFGSSHGRMMD